MISYRTVLVAVVLTVQACGFGSGPSEQATVSEVRSPSETPGTDASPDQVATATQDPSATAAPEQTMASEFRPPSEPPVPGGGLVVLLPADAPADACTSPLPADKQVAIQAAGFAPGAEVTAATGRPDEPGQMVTADEDGVATAVVYTDPVLAQPGAMLLLILAGPGPDGAEVSATGGTTVSGTDWAPCDTDPPTVSFDPPPGSTLEVDARVPLTYSCEDPSGVTMCDANLPNGSLLDTDTPGTIRTTLTAADTVGNSTQETVEWYVGQRTGGGG